MFNHKRNRDRDDNQTHNGFRPKYPYKAQRRSDSRYPDPHSQQQPHRRQQPPQPQQHGYHHHHQSALYPFKSFAPDESKVQLKTAVPIISSSSSSTSQPQYDVCVIVPKGPKYFLWIQHDEIALYAYGDGRSPIIPLNKQYPLEKKTKDTLPFTFGTLLYGTLAYTQYGPGTGPDAPQKIFVTEDILQFKGISTKEVCFGDRLRMVLETLDTIFDKSKGAHFRARDSTTKKCDQQMVVEMTMPTIISQFTPATSFQIPYKVYSLNYYRLSDASSTNGAIFRLNPVANWIDQIKPLLSTTLYEKVFRVKADLQCDIYHLFERSRGEGEANGTSKEAYVDIANISSYKASVRMNRMFRKIKENENLDYLEESDNEEEFEDVGGDKFLNRKVVEKGGLDMLCRWDHMAKRWTPLCRV